MQGIKFQCLINLFREKNSVLLQHLSDDEIHVGAAHDKCADDAEEKPPTKISLAVEVVGTEEAKHEAADDADDKLDDQEKEIVDFFELLLDRLLLGVAVSPDVGGDGPVVPLLLFGPQFLAANLQLWVSLRVDWRGEDEIGGEKQG